MDLSPFVCVSIEVAQILGHEVEIDQFNIGIAQSSGYRARHCARADPLPTARHGLASAASGGRFHVIGGGTKAGALTIVSLSDRMEIFTPPAAD